MIKVYSEKNHAPESEWINHLVHPIRAYWGDGTDEWPTWEKDFSFYKKYFSFVETPSESKVGILPLTLNYYISQNKLDLVNKMADLMKQWSQQLYVWVDGDHEMNYYHSNCIFIKYFGDSILKKNTVIQPGDMKDDLLEKYFKGHFQYRNKSDIPIIGFDGIANYPTSKLVGTITKNTLQHISYKIRNGKEKPDPIFPFLLKRKKILNQLCQSTKLITNFNIRESFAPGTIGNNEQARIEFIKNIINSDYTFCYRGAANYSLRFYETLCLGRIPLFINTNCVLPFENKINWKEVVLWVDENEVELLGEKIHDYHFSMTEKEFTEKQKYCREIWETYLSKEGFIQQFHDEIYQSISAEFLS